MSTVENKFVVLTLTSEEAKIWVVGQDTSPLVIEAPALKEDHHFKNGPKTHDDVHEDPATLAYFEKLSQTLDRASQILIIGHGTGKASALVHFVQFLERKHPNVSKKIGGALYENLPALTEPQILKLAQTWFDSHRQ